MVVIKQEFSTSGTSQEGGSVFKREKKAKNSRYTNNLSIALNSEYNVVLPWFSCILSL